MSIMIWLSWLLLPNLGDYEPRVDIFKEPKIEYAQFIWTEV